MTTLSVLALIFGFVGACYGWGLIFDAPAGLFIVLFSLCIGLLGMHGLTA